MAVATPAEENGGRPGMGTRDGGGGEGEGGKLGAVPTWITEYSRFLPPPWTDAPAITDGVAHWFSNERT